MHRATNESSSSPGMSQLLLLTAAAMGARSFARPRTYSGWLVVFVVTNAAFCAAKSSCARPTTESFTSAAIATFDAKKSAHVAAVAVAKK